MTTFTRISIPLATAILCGGVAAGTAGATAPTADRGGSNAEVGAPVGVLAPRSTESAGTSVFTAGVAQPRAEKSTKAAETVKVKKGKYGKILVDGEGRTLYLFKRDKKDKSTCHGGCAEEWPPMTVDKKARAGKGVKKSELSTTSRGNGEKQVTYNGHPLYRFEGDEKAGQTHGQGLDQFGAKWYVVDTKGKAVVHKPKPGDSPKPKDRDGGY
ncbi:COG4315 family predicted lipoprotein [Streptomyces sp. CA-250714]|uniref:COG4315 family predicted lipoprotein n=1 Tax=Streptomyces sp. CA-250714 TaxID=3240060 RepID=UPI003D914DFA